jgi:hypothetical protein
MFRFQLFIVLSSFSFFGGRALRKHARCHAHRGPQEARKSLKTRETGTV